MLPVAPMGSLDLLRAPAPLTAQLHDQPPQGSAPQKDRPSLRASNPPQPSGNSSRTDAAPPLGVHTTCRRSEPLTQAASAFSGSFPSPAKAWIHDQVMPSLSVISRGIAGSAMLQLEVEDSAR